MRSEDSAEAYPDDPFTLAARRPSVAQAGVDVRVLDSGDAPRAESIGKSLVQMIRARQRPAEYQVIPVPPGAAVGPALEASFVSAQNDLILVTSAIRPWTAAHLDPLLAAIETADHAIGCRPAVGVNARIRRRLGWSVRALLYAVPILDLHSPCRLHRRLPMPKW